MLAEDKSGSAPSPRSRPGSSDRAGLHLPVNSLLAASGCETSSLQNGKQWNSLLSISNSIPLDSGGARGRRVLVGEGTMAEIHGQTVTHVRIALVPDLHPSRLIRRQWSSRSPSERALRHSLRRSSDFSQPEPCRVLACTQAQQRSPRRLRRVNDFCGAVEDADTLYSAYLHLVLAGGDHGLLHCTAGGQWPIRN